MNDKKREMRGGRGGRTYTRQQEGGSVCKPHGRFAVDKLKMEKQRYVSQRDRDMSTASCVFRGAELRAQRTENCSSHSGEPNGLPNIHLHLIDKDLTDAGTCP